MLPKIEADTKGEELKKNTVGGNIKRKKTALEKTQVVDEHGLQKYAEKSMYQQVKTPSGQQRSVFNRHIPLVLEVSTRDYSTFPAGGKYLALVEYLKRDSYRENCA